VLLGRQKEVDGGCDASLLSHFLQVLLRFLGPPVLSVFVYLFNFLGQGHPTLPEILFLDGDGPGLALGHGFQ
jgi:hypothetical protein